MSYIYLASPYSDPDPEVRMLRYRQVGTAVVFLLKAKRWVYSPIVHCHELSLSHNLPTEAAFWQHYNEAMIDACASLYILTLKGYSKSVGVGHETNYAESIGKRIYWVAPKSVGVIE